MNERLALLGLPRRERSSSRRPRLFHQPLLPAVHLPLITPVDLMMEQPKEPKQMNRWAYLTYYLPILKWLPNYDISALPGDAIAGLTLASFQIPLAMSFARNLADLPAVTGLLLIVVAPVVYAVFGTVPMLVVGPQASSAIIYGQVMQQYRDGEFGIFEVSRLKISSVISATLGFILLICGLFRLGFVSKVFSRGLLKGFLAAVVIIMIIKQLPDELGLEKVPGGPWLVIRQVWEDRANIHPLTATISVVLLLMVSIIKRIKGTRFALFPELLAMVVVSTFLSWYYDWHGQGVAVVGNLSVTKIPIQNIMSPGLLSLYKLLISTGILVTILGFFDTATAIRTLESKYNLSVSFNRELVAFGATNLVLLVVLALPAFGTFGRSKILVAAGATTPMAGLVMSTATAGVLVYLVDYLYYLPACVLSLTTTVVAMASLLEIPADLLFYWRVGGYDELFIFILVFVTTLLWLAAAGVFMGIAISLIRVIKYGTTLRIQILGRIPGTQAFRNTDELMEEVFVHENDGDISGEMEVFEHMLVVKIPEPLTFANATDLKQKFLRLQKYRLLLVHPSQPQLVAPPRHVVIDCKGMTAVDTAGIQTLSEIMELVMANPRASVVFSRVPLVEAVREALVRSGIVATVESRTSISGEVPAGLGRGFFLSIEDGVVAGDSA